MNQDLRSEHIVRLISGAKRRLTPPRRDDGLRRLHDWRERVGVVGDEVPEATRRRPVRTATVSVVDANSPARISQPGIPDATRPSAAMSRYPSPEHR